MCPNPKSNSVHKSAVTHIQMVRRCNRAHLMWMWLISVTVTTLGRTRGGFNKVLLNCEGMHLPSICRLQKKKKKREEIRGRSSMHRCSFTLSGASQTVNRFKFYTDICWGEELKMSVGKRFDVTHRSGRQAMFFKIWILCKFLFKTI